jgi:hypothetical protein
MPWARLWAGAERVRYAVATGGSASWVLGSPLPPLARPRPETARWGHGWKNRWSSVIRSCRKQSKELNQKTSDAIGS